MIVHAPGPMAERGLRLLVRCYPPSIRDAFGHDITMTFRDAYMDRVRGPLSFLRFWARALWEGLATIPTAWWEWGTGRRSRYSLGGKRPGRGSGGPRRDWGRADAFAHELRFAVKRVFRRPRFAGAVVGTLAIGIAGVTTLASIVWGVLLAPLPYADADRLVRIFHNQQVFHPRSPPIFALSPRQVEAFRQARTIEELTFTEARIRTPTLLTDGIAEMVDVGYTAGNFLSFLGAGVALGRPYGPSDEAGDEPVVVLAHGTWVRRYGGDPDVLGTHVSLGPRDYRVIGVLEPGFRYVPYPSPVEYWIPRAHQPNRLGYFYIGLARIGPSVTLEDVSRELGAMVIRIVEEDGVEPLLGPEDAAPVFYLQDSLLEFYGHGRQVWILFGAGAIVLLLACANVASLLLVSASERSHELAVRGAIGAGRGRLAVHLLSEAAVLSFLGGSLGAALTPVAMQLLKMGAPEGIPRLESVTVGWPVLAAGLLVTTATVLLVGTFPAWACSRPALDRGLKGHSSGSPTTSRLRGGLLVAQVCGAFVMLLGTGLLVRSYHELATQDLGFRTDGILYGRIRLPLRVFESLGEAEAFGQTLSVVRGSAELAEARRVLKERLAAHPAAGRVTLSHGVPLVGGYSGGQTFQPEGWDGVAAEGEDRSFLNNGVDLSFFQVLDMQLLRGRLLTDEDGREGAAPVAVVSEALASRFWPGEDAVGKRFASPPAMALTDGSWNFQDDPVMTEVVGVVASQRVSDLRLNGRTFYTPLDRAYAPTIANFANANLAFFIESEDMALVAEHARAVLAEVLPGVPLRVFGGLEDVTASELREPRFYAYLLGFFGAYALLLAGLGVAASVAALVSKRRWEIGVRMALGASSPAILQVVVWRASLLTAVGLVLGLGVAFFSAPLLDSMLYGVGPLDPVMYLLTAVMLLGVAVAAASLPVIRGLRLDPAEALRAE